MRRLEIFKILRDTCKLSWYYCILNLMKLSCLTSTFLSLWWNCFTQDMSEWEEDADEYLRKNLPSDIVWKLMIFVSLLAFFFLVISEAFAFSNSGWNFWMERGFVHSQKKCNQLTWCYFNVKGCYLKAYWTMPLSYYFSSFCH